MSISHLLYTDDVTLYVRSEQDMDSLIHLITVYGEDIRISFELLSVVEVLR